MPAHRPFALPTLPFGERISVSETNVQAYADRLSLFNSSLSGYEPVGSPDDFSCKASIIQLQQMKLVAGANTPLHIEYGDAHDINLLVPFQGSVTLQVDGDRHTYGRHQGAMLLPATGRSGRSTAGSSLIFSLSPHRMQEVAQAMLGLDPGQNPSQRDGKAPQLPATFILLISTEPMLLAPML